MKNMLKYRAVFKAYIVILFSLLAFGLSCEEKSKYSPDELSLIFTASVNGEVEPCG